MMWAAIKNLILGRTLREIPVWLERLRWIGRKKPAAVCEQCGGPLSVNWRDGAAYEYCPECGEQGTEFNGDWERLAKRFKNITEGKS